MKNLDIFYLFSKFCHRKFLSTSLTDEEVHFVKSSIHKHRLILWLVFVLSIFVFMGIREVSEISLVINSLIAPVMVTGGAWFAISFGGIPQKLLNSAIEITFWMFLSFVTSFSTMFIAVMYITPFFIWPALIVIFLGVIISCIQYDAADGLKVGLDDALLKHSRAALTFYKTKEGIDVE